MAPTVFRYQSYRFFFNSKEETRKHIHIQTTEGTAKFWIELIVGLADYYNVSDKELNLLMKLVEEKKDVISREWDRHFNQ